MADGVEEGNAAVHRGPARRRGPVRASLDADDALVRSDERFGGAAIEEAHTDFFRMRGEPRSEQLAVAGLVAGQAQAAYQPVLDQRQSRLGTHATIAVEQFVGHATLLEHGDVFNRSVELRFSAKHLQGA